MADVHVEPLVDAEEVVAFWVREGALQETAARERAGQVLLVARIEGELAGVCTAYLERSERLGMPMWAFRLFVAAAHRRSGVARHLGYAGRDLLRERFAAGDHRGQGIVYELHSRALAAADPREWQDIGFHFIGETAEGHHVRVHYFPGVLAPRLPA